METLASSLAVPYGSGSATLVSLTATTVTATRVITPAHSDGVLFEGLGASGVYVVNVDFSTGTFQTVTINQASGQTLLSKTAG